MVEGFITLGKSKLSIIFFWLLDNISTRKDFVCPESFNVLAWLKDSLVFYHFKSFNLEPRAFCPKFYMKVCSLSNYRFSQRIWFNLMQEEIHEWCDARAGWTRTVVLSRLCVILFVKNRAVLTEKIIQTFHRIHTTVELTSIKYSHGTHPRITPL